MLWTFLINAVLAGTAPGIIAIDHVQIAEIEQPFRYSWNGEGAYISTATILVLEVSAAQTGLPQVEAPVLYVGNTPAARINPGTTDRHIVVYVAGHPNISKTPIFWGPDTLPEQVTRPMGDSAQRQYGGEPFSADIVQSITKPAIKFTNQGELYGHIATLIDVYAPSDKSFSDSIRVTLGP